MATRKQTAERRAQLAHDLRAGCRVGQWAPGEMVPTLAQLVKRYQVSAPVVHEEIRKLVDEGVLYSVPRVGTFVSAPSAPSAPFLFLIHDESSSVGHEVRARRGFEERISELGGAVIALREMEASGHFERGELPAIAGVFETTCGQTSQLLREVKVPVARFGRLTENALQSDTVHFDDVEGGRRATEHLLKLGHSAIAYLGLHGEQTDENFFWSQDRELGWQQAMHEAGNSTADLSFHPAIAPQIAESDQINTARELAASVVERREITAVVATNMFAAHGIVAALRAARVPDDAWPALVCFDELEDHVISTLSLPWEEIGRQGAQLLWQRATIQFTGAPRQNLVPMKLIARLTCRPQWAQTTRALGAATPPAIARPVAVAA